MNTKLRNGIGIIVIVFVSGFVGYSIGHGSLNQQGASVYSISGSNAKVITDPVVINHSTVPSIPNSGQLEGSFESITPGSSSQSAYSSFPDMVWEGFRYFLVTPESGGSAVRVNVDNPSGSSPNLNTIANVNTTIPFSATYLGASYPYSTSSIAYTVQACATVWPDNTINEHTTPGINVCGSTVSFVIPPGLTQGTLGESCLGWIRPTGYTGTPWTTTSTGTNSSTAVNSCAYYDPAATLKCSSQVSNYINTAAYPIAQCINSSGSTQNLVHSNLATTRSGTIEITTHL